MLVCPLVLFRRTSLVIGFDKALVNMLAGNGRNCKKTITWISLLLNIRKSAWIRLFEDCPARLPKSGGAYKQVYGVYSQTSTSLIKRSLAVICNKFSPLSFDDVAFRFVDTVKRLLRFFCVLCLTKKKRRASDRDNVFHFNPNEQRRDYKKHYEK